MTKADEVMDALVRIEVGDKVRIYMSAALPDGSDYVRGANDVIGSVVAVFHDTEGRVLQVVAPNGGSYDRYEQHVELLSR